MNRQDDPDYPAPDDQIFIMTQQNPIHNLIRKYNELLIQKKRLNEKLRNDILEGLILAYEDIIIDLKNLEYNLNNPPL